MHPNSLEAHSKHGAKLGRRAREILAELLRGGEGTDREICGRLGLPDMNCVRPRITELIDIGHAVEIGSKRCSVTGTNVRVVAAVK